MSQPDTHNTGIRLSPERYDAVVFDMDGVITDTARVEQRVVETDVPLDEDSLGELRTVVNGATVGLLLQDVTTALRAVPQQLRPDAQTLGGVVVATLIAFGVGYAVIAWFMRYITTHTFTPFMVYRIVLALVLFALLGTGVLEP